MPMISTALVAVQPASNAAAHPTLAEHLIRFGHNALDHLVRLDARDAGLNLLMTAVVLAGALALTWLLRRLFTRWLADLAPMAGDGSPDEDLRRGQKAAGVTLALVRIVTLTGALLLILSIWGVDPWRWLADGAGAKALRLALIVVVSTALVEAAGVAIGRVVEGVARRSGNRRRSAQLRTLGPLLTGSAQGILIVVGVLTFLSELGLKVGPLLASAGVLGIAVGFGAQTIVKDFLTGLFLIAEDVVSVGDNVRIGDSAGVVETMTVRTIRLRSANGTLHIFPYSEAQVIHNRTKVFSSYLFEIVVNYESDLDHALELMGAVGHELQADAAFKDLVTQPFEVLGVDKLGAAGATLKARVTTEPQAQWRIGREYNRRLKAAFDAAGIGTALQTLAARQPSDDGALPPPSEPRTFMARAWRGSLAGRAEI